MRAARRAPLEGFLAVAGLSARAGLRSRLVQGAALLLVGASVTFATSLSGDGSPSGRLQSTLSWSVELTTFVLSLTTVFLATEFAGSLRTGQLVQVCAAPLRREALLTAWWAGTAAVLLLLVTAGFGSVYVCARAAVLLSEEQVRPQLSSILQARGRARPEPPDPEAIRQRAEARFEERLRSGRVPEGLSREEAVELLERSVRTTLRTVPPRQRITWRVSGVRPTTDARTIGLRFRYQAQAIDRAWLGERPAVSGGLILAAPGAEEKFSIPGRWAAGEVHEVQVPAPVLAGGDELLVTYVNLERRPVVVIFPEHGLDVLYPSGGFTVNILRAALVLFGRLLFLAAVGVVASSLIDGRLAAGVVLWFLVMGSGSSFVLESLRPGLFGAVDLPVQALLKAVLAILPDLSAVDLGALIASGQEVDAEATARALGIDGLLRGGFVLSAGAQLFARRELGATRE